jgi:putative ABC transport system permease protein
MASPVSLGHAIRRLVRSPTFSSLCLVTLAVGIGANAAIFSVVEGVLLKPLPYPHPEELVGVWHTAPGVNIKSLNIGPSLYFTYREEGRTFQDVGLWREEAATVTGLAEPERVSALRVTDGVLNLLGVPPLLGRPFSREDDQTGSPPTVVLTYAYWQQRLGGDPKAVGQRLVVDGKAHDIVGVMPQRFRFLDVKASLIVPQRFDRSQVYLGDFSYNGVARLKPGVSLAEANADVARMLPIALERFAPPPGLSRKMFEEARIAPSLRPFKQDLVGDLGSVLWVLMGTIGMVLLIACANVANLLLVRTEARQQELAVRVALGAGRGRIAGEILLESVALGLLGGVLGVGLAYAALRLLVFLAPPNLPRLDEIGIDPLVLAFALVLAVAASALSGLIPVVKYSRLHAGTGLRSGGRTASEGRERHRARNALVVVQVALALVLLVSSGLMIRTFRALREVEPGFSRPEEIQTFRISIPEAQARDEEEAARMQQAILEEVASIPGVTSAAVASSIPMGGESWNDPLFAEDHTYSEGQLPPLRRFKFVGPGFLETMGMSLVRGRDLTWVDTYDRVPVVLVAARLAREMWGDPGAAIGKRIRESAQGTWREVVGVVADEHEDGFDREAPAIVYFPILMKGFEADGMCRSLAFVVRSPRAGSEGFLREIRRAVWSVNASLPVAAPRTLEAVCRRSMARTSFTLVMLALAGAMALLLGVVGIYGVISYAVSQRTREIGIRLALGAQRRQVTSLFVRYGVRLAAFGAGCGLLAAAVLSRVMKSLLFGISPGDPLTFSAVAAFLVAAAVVASYVAARRATRVNPVEALRAE